MSREPAISVVIPAYNAAATLGETLKSVASQDCTDWEAVVVDDGSTDGTSAIASAWAARDPQIRVVRQGNEGLSAARNRGVELALGKYLVFLDADDWLGPGHLAGFLAAATREPAADVLYGTFARVAADGTIHRPKRMPDLSEDAFGVFADRSGGAIHSFMMSRQVVEAVGGFDTALSTCEDWDLLQRIARRGTRFADAPHVVARYRMRHDSMSSDLVRMLCDAREVIERARRPADGATSAPQHAAGADRASMPFAVGSLYLWLAARGAANGQTMPDMDLALPSPPDLDGASDGLIDLLQDGLLVGAAAAPPDAAAVWSKAAPCLTEVLSRWGQATGDPALSEKVVYALERRIMRADPLRRPVTLTRWAGLRVDVAKPIAPLPFRDGVHAVHCRVYRGRELLRTIEFPVFGPMPPEDFARFIVEEVGGMRPYFIASRMALRPSFWMNVAIESARADSADEPGGPHYPLPGDRAHRILHRAVYRTSSPRAAGPTPDAVQPALWRQAASEIRPEPARPVSVAASAAEPVCAEVPVLRYNRVGGGRSRADERSVPVDAFRRQIDFLASRGYRSIGPHDLQQAKRKKLPLTGRPVLISFSVPHADLLDVVAPVLEGAGFSALVFVPPDCVGRGADNTQRGLLSWQDLADLERAGYWFGSSLTRRAATAALPSSVLLQEAQRSRSVIEDRLGVRVDTVAPPFGPCDERTCRLFHIAGYTQVFTPRDGLCDLRHWSLDAPQIEILPEDNLRTFGERIGERGSVHAQ